MTRHVILGGNGIVGRETASALLATGDSVASVGRTESSVPRCRFGPCRCPGRLGRPGRGRAERIPPT